MWFNRRKLVKSLTKIRQPRLEKCFHLKGVVQTVLLRCPFSVNLSKEEERALSTEIENEAISLILKESKVPRNRILTSRSNTRSDTEGVILVCALGHDGSIAGVGVDIEFRTRSTVSQLINRITQNEEREIPLTALKFFCVKEACFKAAGNLQASLKTITEIETHSYNIESHLGTASTGNQCFEFGVEDEESLVVAFAIRRSV